MNAEACVQLVHLKYAMPLLLRSVW
eukprot:COSAG06_NODE_46860_length_343_cov_1.893443_1_plen_24_part_01